jgi:hypothetical protein
MNRRVFLGALAALALAGAPPTTTAPRWWSHIKYLAADELAGRETASEGDRKAAKYIAAQFERAGLKPAGAASAWFQPVPFLTRRIVESESAMELMCDGKAAPVKLGDDAIIGLRVDPAPAIEAPLVFAGYGLTIPEAKYDDLAGLDLRGAIVVSLSGGPKDVAGPLKSHYQSGARYGFLSRAGAIGTITIPNPKTLDTPWSRVAASRTATSMSLADPALDETAGLRFTATWNPERAEALFAASGHTFAEVLAAAEAGKPLPRFGLKTRLGARVRVERSRAESQNVVGVLPGVDPALRREYVVVSAHLDHLGKGHPGAMDDASGIATLIEVAAHLHEIHAVPRRSVLFVAVTAEEKGLLGSRWFATHPTVPRGSVVADINMDMFLPLYPMRAVIAYGLNESDLRKDLESVAGPLGVAVLDDPEPARNSFIRSDQYSFIRNGIPALAFKIGYEKNSPEEKLFKAWLKERYHAPSDDLKQPVDLAAAARFNEFIGKLAEAVANRPDRPQWNRSSFFRRFSN